MPDVLDDGVHVDLDQDERRLMVLALNEYSGLAKHGSELLPPVVGACDADAWSSYYLSLCDTIKRAGQLTNLDWARALFLTEASFGSELLGAGSEWEVGQSGEKDILVLRSLQRKVSTAERSRLLRENVTFPPPTELSGNNRFRAAETACQPVDIDEDEHKLMSTTIGAYANSPGYGFDVLGPMAGQSAIAGWEPYVARLHRAVEDKVDLSDLDWSRALFLTELGFTSAVVGFGSQFSGADQHAISVLRSLQRTIGNRDRRLLFRDNARYSWIR